jgi:hypothetical protein
VKLGNDDAGLFAVKFLGAGELATQKFDELARARATVGPEQAHAEEEHQQLENLGVFDWAEGGLLGGLLGFVQKCGERVVKFALDGGYGRLLVEDAGNQGFVGFRQGSESGEDVRIGCGWLCRAEFSNVERDGREELAVGMDNVGSNADVEKRSVCGESTGVLALITMSGNEVAAVWRAVDGDFALDATTDGADFLRLGRTKTTRLALLTNWTGHERSPESVEGSLARNGENVVRGARNRDPGPVKRLEARNPEEQRSDLRWTVEEPTRDGGVWGTRGNTWFVIRDL